MGKLFLISALVMLFLIVGITGFYLYNQSKPETGPNLNFQPVTKGPVNLTFNLSSPDDNILVYDGNLLVQGKASQGAVVLMSLNDEDQILDLSSSGDFSITAKLDEGLNELQISAVDSLGNSKVEARTVYFSKEKL